MDLTYQDFEGILNVVIGLTTEKKPERILNRILDIGMDITHCDAGTLYLFEGSQLEFKIMKTISLNISRGDDGAAIEDIPPVAYREENVCAYAAIHRKTVNIPDVYHCRDFDFSGPKKYDSLTGYHTQSMLVIPLENNEGTLVGVLQMMNAVDTEGKVIPFDVNYEIIIRSLGCLAAIELTNILYVKEMKEQLGSFVEAMATAIDERTPYNGSHTRNVAKYSLLLAEIMNEKYRQGKCEIFFDEEHMEKIELAALLHDIGKMVIPRQVMNRATRLDRDLKAVKDRFALLECYYQIDYLEGRISQKEYESAAAELKSEIEFICRIDGGEYLDDKDYERIILISGKSYQGGSGITIPYLTKEEAKCLSIRKGTLTEEARELMQSHVEMTAKILDKVRFNRNYSEIQSWAVKHHEFLDGSGYPKHLLGEEIPVETRILTVADIYDALTARDRPYKQAMSPKQAFRILNCMAEEGKIEQRLIDWLFEAVGEEKK